MRAWRRCPEEVARHAVDEIAGRYRVVCLCGWETKFYVSKREAVETWGLHRGRRLTDQSLEAEAEAEAESA